jgi:CheY-like chemotaxis protein
MRATKKIFLVEDDRTYAGFIQRSLENTGKYSISVLETAESCLSELEKNNVPSVLVIDYYLPGMNGIELYSHIRKKFGSLPVIMLSSNSDPNLVLEMVKKGIRQYVIKNENTIASLLALLEGDDDLFINLI